MPKQIVVKAKPGDWNWSEDTCSAPECTYDPSWIVGIHDVTNTVMGDYSIGYSARPTDDTFLLCNVHLDKGFRQMVDMLNQHTEWRGEPSRD